MEIRKAFRVFNKKKYVEIVIKPNKNIDDIMDKYDNF
jgi:hypothetical protein